MKDYIYHMAMKITLTSHFCMQAISFCHHKRNVFIY